MEQSCTGEEHIQTHMQLVCGEGRVGTLGTAYMKRAACIVVVKRVKEREAVRGEGGSSCWLKVPQARDADNDGTEFWSATLKGWCVANQDHVRPSCPRHDTVWPNYAKKRATSPSEFSCIEGCLDYLCYPKLWWQIYKMYLRILILCTTLIKTSILS